MRLSVSTTDMSGATKVRRTSLYPDTAEDLLEAQLARVGRLREFCLMVLGYRPSEIPRSLEDQAELYSSGGQGTSAWQERNRRLTIRQAAGLLGISVATYRVYCDFEIDKNGRSTLRMRDALEMPMRILLLLAPADFPEQVRHYSQLPEWMTQWSAYQLHYWLVTGERPSAGLSGQITDTAGAAILASVSDVPTWKAAFAHLLRVMPIDGTLKTEVIEAVERRQLERMGNTGVDWACMDRLIAAATAQTSEAIEDLDDMWIAYWRVRDQEDLKIPNFFTLLQDHRLSADLLSDPRVVGLVCRFLWCTPDQLQACLSPKVST